MVYFSLRLTLYDLPSAPSRVLTVVLSTRTRAYHLKLAGTTRQGATSVSVFFSGSHK